MEQDDRLSPDNDRYNTANNIPSGKPKTNEEVLDDLRNEFGSDISEGESLSDMDKKVQLIGAMLDGIMPIRESMPEEVAESVDAERQMLVLRAGWGKMSLEELEQLYKGRNDRALPY